MFLTRQTQYVFLNSFNLEPTAQRPLERNIEDHFRFHHTATIKALKYVVLQKENKSNWTIQYMSETDRVILSLHVTYRTLWQLVHSGKF